MSREPLIPRILFFHSFTELMELMVCGNFVRHCCAAPFQVTAVPGGAAPGPVAAAAAAAAASTTAFAVTPVTDCYIERLIALVLYCV